MYQVPDGVISIVGCETFVRYYFCLIVMKSISLFYLHIVCLNFLVDQLIKYFSYNRGDGQYRPIVNYWYFVKAIYVVL